MVLLRAVGASHAEEEATRRPNGHTSHATFEDADKENDSTGSFSHGKRSLSFHKSASVPEPSTPGARIPLADLIGDAERTKPTQLEARSPEERVQWQTSRSPLGSQNTRTPAPRGKKRAQSSSPSRSSGETTSKRLKSNASVLDLNGMAQFLKTPMNDPATELWNRYAPSTSKDTPHGLSAPAFSHLFDSSSPQVEDIRLGNVKGLRRWTSCGVEWPSSKRKRRMQKSAMTHEQTNELAPTPTSQPRRSQDGSQPRPSKISNMLERIQQSLVRDQRGHIDPDAPSSSSPAPPRHESFDRKSISPLRAPEMAARNQGVTSDPIQKSDGTSFGSEDFGSDVLEEVAKQDEKSAVQMEEDLLNADDFDNDFDDDDFGDDDDFNSGDLEQMDALVDQTKTKQAAGGTEGKQDDFGLDDDDDIDEATLVAAEIAATQHLQSGSTQAKAPCSRPRVGAIQRYLVKAVCEAQYTDPRGRPQCEKVLLVEVENSSDVSKSITLRGSWIDSRCTKGSYVHVIGDFDARGQIVIDDSNNMLILHPDHLISALVVADSFDCIRRAVLQDRVKATSEASPPMVYGTMVHEILQEALKASRWDDDFLGAAIAKSIAMHIEDLYQIKLTPEHVTEHLMSKMPAIQGWCEVFVKARPDAQSMAQDRNRAKVSMSVSKLLDVEEHIWSPMYGLKGNIDATVQIEVDEEGGRRTLVAPFEIKTGKRPATSHRAQTALYTLLLSDRYDVAVAYGILYYSETSEISRVPALRHELRHMIMQRNELACYVREKLSLPPMVRDTRKCNQCYAKTACFLYHRLAEDGDGETSGMRDKFTAVTKHLKPAHQEFFKKWDDLLTKEEAEMMKFRRELWTMLSTEREKLGRAFANVILEPASGTEIVDGSKINRYHYVFQKLEKSPGFSFAESQLIAGEPIVVSDEKGHYALAKGYVTSVLDTRITVAVDRLLKNARTRLPGFDDASNQVFSGLIDSGDMDKDAKPLLYRLDKDEFSNGMATVRNNLIQTMTEDVFGARSIRELVVERRAPRFKPASSAYELSGPQSQLDVNDDQRNAIEKIMCAEDYALVLGMPGTGKTTTIAHIIRALVAKGKSILLASYTHTAVDNILLKIQHDDISVLRLGQIAKVHPEVQRFATLAAEPRTSLDDIHRAFHDPQVVATTCLGIGHQLFKERVFDYCIVDEASQITLPVCLGPIRMARAFVLVGDHFQLPPLVQNKEALQGGLDVSLFKLLCEAHPAAVATLRHQYRMNAPIMSIANSLIYDGALVCGTERVASQTLALPRYSKLMELHDASSQTQAGCPSPWISSCWLHRVLHPDDSPAVVFINTDKMAPASLETQKASRITNACEALLVTRLSRALILAGLAPSSLGIITLYRSQLAMIKSMMHSSEHGIPRHQAAEIEAHTADRYQGRDKEAILLSCVRSNERACIGDLLKDWRRLNVAVTRARRKLVIVGSRSTLSRGDELLAKLVELCDASGWTVDLPFEAAEDTAHCWSSLLPATQSAADIRPLKHAQSSLKEPESPSDGNQDVRPAPRIPKRQQQQQYVNKPFKQPAARARVPPKAVLRQGGVLADVAREVLSDCVLP